MQKDQFINRLKNQFIDAPLSVVQSKSFRLPIFTVHNLHHPVDSRSIQSQSLR